MDWRNPLNPGHSDVVRGAIWPVCFNYSTLVGTSPSLDSRDGAKIGVDVVSQPTSRIKAREKDGRGAGFRGFAVHFGRIGEVSKLAAGGRVDGRRTRYTIRNGEHGGDLVWVSEAKKSSRGKGMEIRTTGGTRLRGRGGKRRRGYKKI